MSELSDALSFIDEFTSKQQSKLTRTAASVGKKSAGTPQGKVDAEMKSLYAPAAKDSLANTPLSNVADDTVEGAVGELSSQLLNSSTNRFTQLPNRVTESSFSSLSKTDSVSGSGSNNSILSNSGVMGRQSPLIGFLDAGATSQVGATSFTVGGREISTAGVTDLIKKQALDRLEKTVNAKVGFNIREVVKDVQQAAITVTTVLSTAKIDIAMELIRQNALLILAALDRKDKIIDKLKEEIMALHNLVAIVLGGFPNFEEYLRDLIRAYNLILSADNDLKSVVRTLQNIKLYNARLFERAMTNLNTALKLILPNEKGPPARIQEFINAVLTRSTSKEALNAALAIPGVTQKVASLMLEYGKETLTINGLLKVFLTALDSFLNSFQRNSTVDQATIDHINSAIKQLDALLADMQVELFPTDGREKTGAYPTEVTSAAAGWGVRLSTIIQWLSANPAVGSAVLDLTQANVVSYRAAVASLKALGNRKKGLATLKVTEAQEDIVDTSKQVGRLMITANTALNPKKTKQQISADFQQIYDLVQLAKDLDSDIRAILNVYVNVQSSFSKNVSAVTGSLTKLFDELGLKRGSDILKKADFANFFSLTPSTATYAGAAAAGLGAILKTISKSSSLTDQDFSRVSEMKDNFDRAADVDLTEASRSFGAQDSIFVAQIQETIKNQSALSTTVKAIASRFDDSVGDQDALAITEQYAKKAIGSRFSFGAS